MRKIIIAAVLLIPAFGLYGKGRPDHTWELSGLYLPAADFDSRVYSFKLDDLLYKSDDSSFRTMINGNTRRTDAGEFPGKTYSVSGMAHFISDHFFAIAGTGVAADRMIDKVSHMNLMLSAGFDIYSEETHTFQGMIYYSTDVDVIRLGGYVMPLPFFNYTYKKDGTVVNAGIPFFIMHRSGKSTFTFFAVPLYNIETSYKYSFMPFIHLEGGLQLKTEKFHTDNFTRHRYLQNNTVFLKYSMYTTMNTGFFIKTGYLFRSFHYTGEDSLDFDEKRRISNSYLVQGGVNVFF